MTTNLQISGAPADEKRKWHPTSSVHILLERITITYPFVANECQRQIEIAVEM